MAAAVRYAGERRQFGKEIIGFQAVQLMIADMAIGVQAAQSLTYGAVHALARDHPLATRLVTEAKGVRAEPDARH